MTRCTLYTPFTPPLHPPATLTQASPDWLLSSHVTPGGRRLSESEESGVGVLDDALAAEFLNGAVAFDCDEAILNIQLSQAAAVVGDGADALISDQFAAFDAEFLQVGAVLGQKAEASVGDVAFAQVEGAETRAAAG